MSIDLGEAMWRKSSYSGQTGSCVEVTAWRKSSYSGAVQNCVEVDGAGRGVVAVRDSKDPGGDPLVVTPAAWRSLTRQVKDGRPG
jgi:hypothetical protein